MARFAPVAPARILEGFHKINDIGNYHLPLAHDVLNNKDIYGQLFHPGLANHWHDKNLGDRVVILDNSVIELGNAVDIDVIAEAAEIVQANVIVLPDVLLDCDATIERCQSAVRSWGSVLSKRLKNADWAFMIVPQGKTPQEFARCAERFAYSPYIGWWGVPRNYNIHGLGSRRDAVQILQALNPKRHIHLLGFSDNIIDDVLSARMPGVDGIDSAVPIRAASLGLDMSLSLDAVLPARGTWWDDPKTQFLPLMRSNLNRMRHLVKTED